MALREEELWRDGGTGKGLITEEMDKTSMVPTSIDMTMIEQTGAVGENESEDYSIWPERPRIKEVFSLTSGTPEIADIRGLYPSVFQVF